MVYFPTVSLINDVAGAPGKLVEVLGGLPLALLDLQRSVDRLADVCQEMAVDVKGMREGVELLREEVSILKQVDEGVSLMNVDVARMRAGVENLLPAVESLSTDLGRLPFIRRRGVA